MARALSRAVRRAALTVISIAVMGSPARAGEAEAEARAHFEKGVALVEQSAWAEALSEFTVSRRLHASWKAAKNAAACLAELGRYDEALDLLDAIGRDFPDLPANARADVAAASEKLRPKVGIIVIGGGEPGASVMIDERLRGELPAAAELRVIAGAHVVRINKDGFEPVEAQVSVTAGQRAAVDGTLRALVGAGRLRVIEAAGLSLDVLIDGREVGRTPWEGTVGAGPHLLSLFGPDRLGTQPIIVRVEAQGKATARLTAEPMRAILAISASPTHAAITLDGTPVGAGTWGGPVREGEHAVDVAAEGYLPARRALRIAAGDGASVRVALEEDPYAPVWRARPRLALALDARAFIMPTMGGDLAATCGPGCGSTPALGGRFALRGGVALRSWLSFGLSAGAVAADQRTTARPTTITPVGLAPVAGTADDTLKLRAFVGGAWGAVTFGDRSIIRLGLGAGAVAGTLGVSRTGGFGGAAVGPVGDAPRALFAYVEPEIAGGIRLGKHFELTAALGAMILIDAVRPTWDSAHAVNAGKNGLAFFAAERLTSDVTIAITPGIALRYER